MAYFAPALGPVAICRPTHTTPHPATTTNTSQAVAVFIPTV